MALIILRCVFMVVAVGIGSILISLSMQTDGPGWLPWVAFLGTTSLAAGVIAADSFIHRKQIDIISGVYVGLLVGVLLTYIFTLALEPLLASYVREEGRVATRLLLGMVLCYTCISLLLQTKDDFRFIIPYVEFSKEVKGLKPYVLDTSVVIDGRIADLVETNVLDNQLVMPRFVLSELQSIADSGDKMRRARGRRGLDVLNRLRNNEHVDFKIYDRELPEMEGQPVDMKLVLLAKHIEGKVVTGDYNLNKVARLHNVSVINLNDIANSLKPVYLPGESFAVRLVKSGEEVGQGIGYLDD
ncbi:MAG: PIN domain-containing protein, partial [Pirellulaceae bacterium]